MEATKVNLSKISGVIIMICALGIAAVNIILKENPDSFIMPFILFVVGISFISKKQSAETKQPVISAKKQRIILATLSISLIAGIVIFINAFFL